MATVLRLEAALAFVVALGVSSPASGCTAIWGTPPDWVSGASVIVRARAVEVIDSASIGRPRWKTKVRFEMIEVLKGTTSNSELAFEGKLSERDDLNDLSVPYSQVRPQGRRGLRYAFYYRLGREYLLLLKRVDGVLTPYWASQAATNEQVSGPDDRWLLWVRRALNSK